MTLGSGHLLYTWKGTWDTKLNSVKTRTLAVQGSPDLAALASGFPWKFKMSTKAHILEPSAQRDKHSHHLAGRLGAQQSPKVPSYPRDHSSPECCASL